MAERKAVNKYYPPDWDPSKGSVNKHVGQHPLRERARKLSQGILIIRFEMPYNIWCNGCGNHIGMGVRYNAEKKKVGNYYTTPIYRFRMKCHLCDNYMEIETDPKNCDYTIVSGARRKEERWDPSATENVQATDYAEKQKLIDDAMYKLEHGQKDKQKSKAAIPGLVQIKDIQSQWKDDFALNQMLRKKFRQEKKVILAKEEKVQEIKEKGSLDIELVNEEPDDIQLAKKIKFHSAGFQENQRKRRLQIKARPMFTEKGKTDKNSDRVSLLEKRQRMQISKPNVGVASTLFLKDSSSLGIRTKISKDKASPGNIKPNANNRRPNSRGQISADEVNIEAPDREDICQDQTTSPSFEEEHLPGNIVHLRSDNSSGFVTRTFSETTKGSVSIDNQQNSSHNCNPTPSSDIVGKEKSLQNISLISEMYSDTDSDSSK